MIRTFATTTIVMAMFGVAACKGGASSAVQDLIPESAGAVGGVDFAALQGTKFWSEHRAEIEAQSQETVDGMTACNLGFEKWKTLTVGVDPEAPNEKMAAVLVADGLGKKENLECIAQHVKAQNDGKDPWTAEEDSKVLKMDGGSVAYVVNDNTVAVSSQAWAEDVKKLTKGEGKAVFAGPLKSAIDLTKTGKHMWFAARLPAQAKQLTQSVGDIGDAKELAGWIDLSAGLELFIALNMASAEDATKAKNVFQTQFDNFKGTMVQLGLPQNVVDSVALEAKDTAVNMTVKASDEELKAVEAKAKQTVGGLM